MKVYIFFFFSCLMVQSQSFQVEGTVANNQNEPLSYVNVLLLKSQDSVFVKGTATDDNGKFLLQDTPHGEYILKCTFIGYEDLYLPLNVNSNKNIGQLTLLPATEDLDEVSILVKAPTVTRQIDRLIFNVENTSLSSGSTWDILNKTPGVIIQQNSLSVQNQNATIYINDKKVNLTAAELQNLLESYSGNNIKSIEVITKPSARYEAESGVIINIVTSKNLITGYKGNIQANYTQAIFAKYRLGTSHYFKNDWVNLSVAYSYSPRKEHKNDLTKIVFFEPDNSVNSIWETDFLRVTRSAAHNLNTSVDFALSEKSSLNFSSFILIEPNTTYNNSEMAHIFNPQMQVDSIFKTYSFLRNDIDNLAFDLTFNQQLGKKGANLIANAHYTSYDHIRGQNVNTNYYLPDGNFLRDNKFLTDAHQHIDIYVSQLDFEIPVGSTTMETGSRLSAIRSESGIDFFDVENNTQQPNPSLSDNFFYDENIIAAYFNVMKKSEDWSYSAGLRGEYTRTKGNSISMSQINENDYIELFPSVLVGYNLNENHTFNASYKRSVSRPRYDLLNPFRYFINENNFSSGNPDLLPGITNRVGLEYILKNKYSFEGYFRRGTNDIDVLSFQNNEHRFLQSLSANLDEKIGYGLIFNYNTSVYPWWYFSTYTSLFHEEHTFRAIESDNRLVTIATNGAFFWTNNNFTLSKDRTFSGNLTFLYLSSFVSGSYIMDDYATLTIGLRKTLWQNRAVASLTVNDIFNTTNRNLRSEYLNQNNSYFAQIETQYIQLGFIYNFGNFRLRDNSRQIRVEERNRI